jgi:uncharacterized protein
MTCATMGDASEPPRTVWKQPFAYFAWLIPAWIGAWLVHDRTSVAQWSPAAEVGYWTAAKLLVWMLPLLFVVRQHARGRVREYLSLVRPSAGVRVGLVIGLTFAALAATLDWFTKTHHWPALTMGLLSALTVAPLFEEVMFRGFALQALEDRGHGFWSANAIAALMFLGLHVPGWYFMGSLRASQAAVGVSVVLVGLVAGYAKRRARSTWASVAVHFLNNLYSASVV